MSTFSNLHKIWAPALTSRSCRPTLPSTSSCFLHQLGWPSFCPSNPPRALALAIPLPGCPTPSSFQVYLPRGEPQPSHPKQPTTHPHPSCVFGSFQSTWHYLQLSMHTSIVSLHPRHMCTLELLLPHEGLSLSNSLSLPRAGIVPGTEDALHKGLSSNGVQDTHSGRQQGVWGTS